MILERIPTTSFCIFCDFSSTLDKYYFFYELKKKGISNNILWHPFSTEIFRHIEKAKLLLLPSLIEGSPMVISEARQLGTPCILFGLNYLDNGNDGVIHVNKCHDLPKIVESLISDEKYWSKYSLAAKKNLETWSDKSVLLIWEKMLSDLAKHPQRISVAESTCPRPNFNHIMAIQELYKAIDFLEDQKITIKSCFRSLRSFINLLHFVRNFLRK